MRQKYKTEVKITFEPTPVQKYKLEVVMCWITKLSLIHKIKNMEIKILIYRSPHTHYFQFTTVICNTMISNRDFAFRR